MIKLSKLTDYAVVILAEMARNKGLRMSASGLSEVTKLPEPTVSKVLKLLAKSSIITSERGVNGGYVLEGVAGTIRMVDVITALEGPIAIASCVEGKPECCAYENACAVKGQWNPVNAAIISALSTVTLADMMKGRP